MSEALLRTLCLENEGYDFRDRKANDAGDIDPPVGPLTLAPSFEERL